MNPLFFGSSAEPLFGLYSAPQQAAKSRGVLLCNPFGDEAIKAHRAYRQLAERLVAQRYHVLRFDYFGSGDSAGEDHQASVPRWLDDIRAALDELRDISSVSKISLVGLRFGAALALMAASGRRDVDRVVLWDPVVSGRDYLRLLRRAHQAYLGEELGGRWHSRAPETETGEEVMGFSLSPEMVRGIQESNLERLTISKLRKVSLVVSRHSPRYVELASNLARQNVDVATHYVEGGINWNSDDAMSASIVPTEALRSIEATLG